MGEAPGGASDAGLPLHILGQDGGGGFSPA